MIRNWPVAPHTPRVDHMASLRASLDAVVSFLWADSAANEVLRLVEGMTGPEIAERTGYAPNGLMARREASINDLSIEEADRRILGSRLASFVGANALVPDAAAVGQDQGRLREPARRPEVELVVAVPRARIDERPPVGRPE